MVVGYIIKRYGFETARAVNVLQYDNAPLEAQKKSDTGKALVQGRISITNAGDFLLIGETPFYISAVSYERKTGCTTLTVGEALLAFDVHKYQKPTGETIKTVTELNRMTYDLNETYVSQTSGGETINLPSGTFVDPVFKMSYCSFGGKWEEFIQLAAEKNSNIMQISTFKDWGDKSFYSLCDVLRALRTGFTIYNNAKAQGEDVRYHVDFFGNCAVNLSEPANDMKTVVIDSRTILLSEEYEEGDFFTLVTSFNQGVRRNYARYIEEGVIQNPTTTDSFCFSVGNNPIPLTGVNPTTGKQTQRVPFGKWANAVNDTPYVEKDFLDGVKNHFWDNEKGQYKISFASPERFYTGDKVRLLFDDEERTVEIGSVTISSDYPDMYIYTCGTLPAKLSDKIHFLMPKRGNTEVIIDE